MAAHSRLLIFNFFPAGKNIPTSVALVCCLEYSHCYGRAEPSVLPNYTECKKETHRYNLQNSGWDPKFIVHDPYFCLHKDLPPPVSVISSFQMQTLSTFEKLFQRTLQAARADFQGWGTCSRRVESGRIFEKRIKKCLSQSSCPPSLQKVIWSRGLSYVVVFWWCYINYY